MIANKKSSNACQPTEESDTTSNIPSDYERVEI